MKSIKSLFLMYKYFDQSVFILYVNVASLACKSINKWLLFMQRAFVCLSGCPCLSVCALWMIHMFGLCMNHGIMVSILDICGIVRTQC